MELVAKKFRDVLFLFDLNGYYVMPCAMSFINFLIYCQIFLIVRYR